LAAPELGGSPLALGGSFRSDRAQDLRADAARVLEPDRSPSDVGLRLARFVPPPDDPPRAAAFDAELARALARREVVAVEEWRIGSAGDLSLALRAAGRDGEGFERPLPGFARIDEAGPEPRAFRLRALAGLHQRGASCVLRLPLPAPAAGRRLIRVRWPRGCRVEAVD